MEPTVTLMDINAAKFTITPTRFAIKMPMRFDAALSARVVAFAKVVAAALGTPTQSLRGKVTTTGRLYVRMKKITTMKREPSRRAQMLPIDPKIVQSVQWLLFLGGAAFWVWGTGYALWASIQLGEHWLAWLGRKRTFQKEKLEADTKHYLAVKELELKALQVTQDMNLAREKVHNDVLYGTEEKKGGEHSSPPVSIKSLG